jgi:hypothetical protein
VLAFGITLMLYSSHLENGHPVGYAIRYLREASNGALIADVMLLPTFEMPR